MDRNRLFSYHQWATLECLRHVQSLGEELYRREGQNSFASIEKTMEHVIGVEKLWLMRMAATENPAFEYFDVETPEKGHRSVYAAARRNGIVHLCTDGRAMAGEVEV
nr:DinB family protein [Planococcus glaciei]